MSHLFRNILFLVGLIFTLLISYPKQGIASLTQDDQLMTSSNAEKFVTPVVKLNHQVSLLDIKKVINTATGFSVGYDKKTDTSYILTNNHFCKQYVPDETLNRIFYEDSDTVMSLSKYYETGEVKILKQDPSKDLCLLAAEGFIKPVKIVPSNYVIKQMDPVFIVGAPNNIFPIITQTYFSTYFLRDDAPDQMDEGNSLLMFSGIVYSGHSGSPIYNSQGKVVGIVFMNLQSENGPVYGTLAISYKDINQFLQDSKISF